MPSNIPYAPKVEKFTKTKEFSFLAEFFKKNKCYTLLPEGTNDYVNFWREVRDFCINGYTNSVGITIPGSYFFYLNFIQILGKNEETGRKTKIFPRFLDVDYDYFWITEYCKKNQKNLILVKPRRLGFSYKAAGLGTHEFTFFRDSKTIVSAFYSKYSQNTMNMIVDNLNFLKEFTEFGKERNPDTPEFVKARFQKNIGGEGNKVKIWSGYMSEARMITFKDNPFASVGLTASWFFMDEAGIFPNIIDAYNMSEPCIKDGADYTGTALIFGSAGSMEGGSQYFYEMFMNPSKYNALEFPNPIDPENPSKNTGWFVSSTRGRLGTSKNTGKILIDEEGNSLEINAEEDILLEREKKKGGTSKQALHDIITQYPLNIGEAFMRSSIGIFPVAELNERLAQLETNSKLRDSGKVGELYFDKDNRVQFRLNQDLNYITDYPLKSGDNKNGSVCTWEDPERINGEIPPHLYIAGCDPYDQDDSNYSSSLGSFFIYKRFLSANKTNDIIVAEYTSRPESADDFYEICRRLCLYYNAKVLYENNLKGLKAYFQQKHSLFLMYETPSILKDIVKDSRVDRGYGIHMSPGIKRQCEIYLKDWLIQSRKDNDVETINAYSILSIPLIKELIAYNPEEGNFDRVIAFMLCVLQLKESYKIDLESMISENKADSFFSKKIFKKNKRY